MRYYVDTSALCRLYHAEPGSERVEEIAGRADSLLVISWLTELEVVSAFALKARTGDLEVASFLQLSRAVKADIVRRRLFVVRVLRRHFTSAQQLVSRYGHERRIRSLDALHLGIALDLHAQQRIDTLITADSLLDEIAQREGLAVVNPLRV